ncbi:lysoplasmalogenase [Echinicola marina]|uniref:lysoplasmalogenase n=1 Tax=Echinicola marina TaxID=2859768 RepID=UPI001CF7148A|nr:lysoplasmalogenase [Echinicola marina]UCS94289.1 lysoplasmalogenase [Echinicola marina]
MQTKAIGWLYLYLFAGLADISLIIQQQDDLRFLSKPLLMISLCAYFLSTTSVIKNTLLRKSVGTALILSLIGDVLLLFPQMFLYGLGAFFIAQVCYIIAFKLIQNHQINLRQINFLKIFFFNLPIYIVASIIYFLINDNLHQLKTPVIFYILAMVMMASTARERFKRTNTQSFVQVFLGAILFLVSDSIIALDLFFQPINNSGVLIMGTYILAQLLIVMGIRSHLVHSPTKTKDQ